MAFTTPTLSSAFAITDTILNVTSATGFAAGNYLRVDQEFVRISKQYVSGTVIPLDGRGLNGTVAAAHVSGANITAGLPSDWTNPSASVITAYPLAGLRRKVMSYSAAGAITLPSSGEDMIAIINGTTGLAMTVAVPTKDIDSALLWIASNGAATTHTVQFTGGLSGGGANYDVLTINTTAPVLLGPFMAVNGLWQAAAGVAIAGTVTALTATIG